MLLQLAGNLNYFEGKFRKKICKIGLYVAVHAKCGENPCNLQQKSIQLEYEFLKNHSFSVNHLQNCRLGLCTSFRCPPPLTLYPPHSSLSCQLSFCF